MRRRGAGEKGSGGAPSAPSFRSAGWPPFGRRVSVYLSGTRGRLGFSPAPRPCGPTTNPRALCHQEPRFLQSNVCKEGSGYTQQSTGSFRSHLLGFQTRKKARGGGRDTGRITNTREPSSGIAVHSKSLRAALRSRAIVSAAG